MPPVAKMRRRPPSSLQGYALVVLLACAGTCAAQTGDLSDATVYTRKNPKPQLPVDHPRLARGPLLAPKAPEQIHISLAGPGAIAINWVTPLPRISLTGGLLHRLSRRILPPLRMLGKKSCAGISTVQYGLGSGQYVSEVSGRPPSCYSVGDYDSGILHEAIIGLDAPLPPNTEIFYRVSGAGGDIWSEEFVFTTPPGVGPDSLPYRLGVVGDLGQTEDSLDTLRHLVATNPDSVMLVGDLSYADGDHNRWDSWNRMVSPLTARGVWMFTEGNHEREAANGVPDWLAYTSRFHLPHATSGSPDPLYYSYEVAGMHVVMLGSYAQHGRQSEQVAWLAADLAGVDRARTPWVIVSMHAPFYCSNLAHLGEGEPMRASMERLLHENGVDLVFAGHVHAYERSLSVYDGEAVDCGPVYINIGDGGNREGPDTRWLPRPEWSLWREPSFGHGALDLLNTTHALWTWHRNQDAIMGAEAGDSVMLSRGNCWERGLRGRGTAAGQADVTAVA